MREFSNHAVLSMSDSTMAVSSKYTQDLSVQIVFFTLTCKWFLCFYFWAVIWSYIVDLFAALHELASASSRTLLKLASSVRALLKPYGDTLNSKILCPQSPSILVPRPRRLRDEKRAMGTRMFLSNRHFWVCMVHINTRHDFVAYDKRTTCLQHELFLVNQTYNSIFVV